MGKPKPNPDPNARGVFFRLATINNKYDMPRSVMEGVIYAQRQCLDVHRKMGIEFSEVYATGGGATSSLWRQMIADIFELPVVTIQNREGPALGAAILAGVGVGIYPSIPEACRRIIKQNQAQNPIAENIKKYTPYYDLYCELYPGMKKSFQTLAKL